MFLQDGAAVLVTVVTAHGDMMHSMHKVDEKSFHDMCELFCCLRKHAADLVRDIDFLN